jgi:hypothetical protein
VKITYDPAKREKTLRARGLDFEDAATVFAGLQLTRLDEATTTARTATDLWPARRSARHGGLDPAPRQSPDYFDEVMP